MIATYLALITLLDDCVGRILATLRATETLDDTLVVLVSDHGDQLGEHGMAGKMGNLYEASIRVPLVIRLPGAAHAGADRGQLAEMVDLFPTICDLLGVAHPGGTAGTRWTQSGAGGGRRRRRAPADRACDAVGRPDGAHRVLEAQLPRR